MYTLYLLEAIYIATHAWLIKLGMHWFLEIAFLHEVSRLEPNVPA